MVANLDASCAYILDDDRTICDSLSFLLKSIEIRTKTFLRVEDFFSAFEHIVPGCVLLDVRMPGISGLQVQERIKSYRLPVQVVFMTAYQDIEVVVQSLKAGATDILFKPFCEQRLLDAVQHAVSQSRALYRVYQRIEHWRVSFSTLTSRENEVLQCVVTGMLNKNISSTLEISTKTVELHRANIMKKTKSKTLADLVKKHALLDALTTLTSPFISRNQSISRLALQYDEI